MLQSKWVLKLIKPPLVKDPCAINPEPKINDVQELGQLDSYERSQEHNMYQTSNNIIQMDSARETINTLRWGGDE